MIRTFIRLLAVLLFTAPLSLSQTSPGSSATQSVSSTHGLPASQKVPEKAMSTLGRLPLSFQPNLGQTDSRVQWLSQGPEYTLFLTGHDAVLKLEKTAPAPSGGESLARMRREVSATSIRMQLVGANFPTAAVPEEPQVRQIELLHRQRSLEVAARRPVVRPRSLEWSLSRGRPCVLRPSRRA